MQTHRDDDHGMNEDFRKLMNAEAEKAEAWERLRVEAAEMEAAHASTITAGDPGEMEVRSWQRFGVHVRVLPERETDEALGLCRVSVGGIPGDMAYCVFRGPIKEVKDTLRRALNALRDEP